MNTPIRAFLSCRYDEVDRVAIVAPIKGLIKDCGIEVYEVDTAGVSGDLSSAIINGIKRCDMFINVVTSDDGSGPTHTRPWLVSEIGIASAFNKEIVIFRDDRVEHVNLGVALGLVSEKFSRDQPLNQRDTMCRKLKNAVAKLQSTVRIVRDDDLHERIIKVVVPHRKEPINVRELVVGREKGRMDWDTFIRGYEILAEQLDEAKAFPLHLWVGVNATGINIASYLDGRADTHKLRRIPYGTIKSSPEDPDTYAREFDVALPPKPTLSGKQRPTVLIVDSQLKSGASQSAIRNIIMEHFDRDLTFHHAALIANGVKSPSGPEPELEMQELFNRPLNTNDRLPKHLPSFLAYISLSNIKPPEGLP